MDQLAVQAQVTPGGCPVAACKNELMEFLGLAGHHHRVISLSWLL